MQLLRFVVQSIVLTAAVLLAASPASAAGGSMYSNVYAISAEPRDYSTQGHVFVTFTSMGSFGKCATGTGGRLWLGVAATEHGRNVLEMAKLAAQNGWNVMVSWDDTRQVGPGLCELVKLVVFPPMWD